MPPPDGIVTVHVRVVTPAPTYVHCTKVVFADPTGASASQSCAPPAPPVSVTVTADPPTAVVVFTVSVGAGAPVTVTVGLVAARL